MKYQYKAIRDNKVFVNQIQADSQQAVLAYLKENGYFPIEIKVMRAWSPAFIQKLLDKVNFNDIVDLTRQMAIMLNAGLTIIEVLDILKKQTTKQSLLRMIEDIDKHVKAGNPLSIALKTYPEHFHNLYIALVKSGETSGKLSDILLKLSENLEKQREFRSKLKGALIYPVVVVVAMVLVMFIMVTFVIPRLLSLYKDFEIALPLTTQILILISSFSSRFWPFIVVFVGGVFFLIRRYLRTKAGRFLLDSTLLKIPLVEKVIKIASLVDATRTLAVLIGAGVSILDSLEIVIETTDNVIFQNSFKEIYKKVEKGQSLGSALAGEGIFPPILVQMTIVGENTGHLDDTLLRLSKYFESESELAIKAMTTLIEPAVLVLLGAGVGFLVISVITPIYNLTTSFK